MDADLLVRGGTIVDGTGAPRFAGSVAVVGNRLVVLRDPGGGAGGHGRGRQRKRLYFRMHQRAAKPSFQPIFFPSS